MFFQTKSNPIQQFYIKIQSKLKMIPMHQKQCQSRNLPYQTDKKHSQTSYNDRSSVSMVVINMYDEMTQLVD